MKYIISTTIMGLAIFTLVITVVVAQASETVTGSGDTTSALSITNSVLHQQ